MDCKNTWEVVSRHSERSEESTCLPVGRDPSAKKRPQDDSIFFMKRGPEYEHETYEKGNGGFSEKEMDLDIEVRAGEWQNLKKFKAYQKRSRQGKIIATYQAVSNRLNQLVALYYKFVSINPEKGAILLKELRKLRMIQEVLLTCLTWTKETGKDADGLEEKSIPKEVWELIE